MQPGGGSPRSALPYKTLAGVEPVTGGWLVAPGNIQGITLTPQPPFVLPSLAEVLDYRPAFAVLALHAPVGLPEPGSVRECDRNARSRLGPRAKAVLVAPSRKLLEAVTYEEARAIDPSVDIVRWRSLSRASEVEREVQSWRQRTVWEVHPELGFTEMNDGVPLSASRRSIHGRRARLELVRTKLPGVERALAERPRGVREEKLLDALADLWTARRILARAVVRSCEEPSWDSEGVRMDIVS